MYKDIIVCVNDVAGRDNAVRAAARFAKEIDANLTALYVRINDEVPVGLYGFATAGYMKETKSREDEHIASVKADFEAIIQGEDFTAGWLEVAEQNSPLRAIAYADLVISSQAAYDPRRGQTSVAFINNLILETGRPVILVPTEWTDLSFGSKIVLGWDESREAVRSMHDAMPLLQKADQVDVVSVNNKNEDEQVDITQVSSFLKRRNVNSHFNFEVTSEDFNSAEKVLLHFAHAHAASLIVVGGYGHTRLREIILGGVTRHLINHSDIPVLLSH